MRRALLTAVQGASVFLVGQDPIAAGAGNFNTSRLFVPIANPATRAGTLTTLRIYCGAPASITAVTGTLSGTTFTVKQSVALSAATSGLNQLTMSLPIAAGDYVGFWSADTAPQTAATSGASFFSAFSSAAPTGAISGAISTGTAIEMQATGI